MTRRSPSSLSTQLLLVVLASNIPALILICCGKMDIFNGAWAVVLGLIIAWLGCKQFVQRPLNALVKATQQAANGAVRLQIIPALKIAEFAQLVESINEILAAVRDRSSKRRGVEHLYKQLVKSLPEALLVQQADGIVLANPTAMTLLGATSMTQLTDRFIMEMVHPDHHEAFQQHIAQLRKGDPFLLLEGKLLRLDGAAVEVEVAMAVVDYQDKPAVQFIARDITKRKQAEQQLHELSMRLLKVQDEERRRLSRDLHDSTAQELAAMMASLGVIEEAMAGADEPIRQRFAECRQLAEHCSKQIRTTSYLLHPPLLDELGLVGALKHHVAGLAGRTHIRVTLELQLDMSRLPPETELALFRVVQESLNNVQRHSGSNTAAIRLLRDAENIVLEVQDRGHGLPFAVVDNTQLPIECLGVGIAGMQERLQHLGGRLNIISSSQGTTVRAVLPRQEVQL